MVSTTHQAESFKPGYFARQLDCKPETIIRWCKRGVLLTSGARLYLEYLAMPRGSVRITQEAADAFLEALDNDRPRNTPAMATKSTGRRSAEAENVRAELRKLGF
jgi:hypothetical protein